MKAREKLVRDLLDARIPADEVRVETDPAEVERLLLAKLDEETAELAASGHADVAEYADVFEVLLALAARKGIPAEAIEATRRQKLASRGGFERGLVYAPKAELGLVRGLALAAAASAAVAAASLCALMHFTREGRFGLAAPATIGAVGFALLAAILERFSRKATLLRGRVSG